MSSQDLTAVVAAWQAGALSRGTMFELFRRGRFCRRGGATRTRRRWSKLDLPPGTEHEETEKTEGRGLAECESRLAANNPGCRYEEHKEREDQEECRQPPVGPASAPQDWEKHGHSEERDCGCDENASRFGLAAMAERSVREDVLPGIVENGRPNQQHETEAASKSQPDSRKINRSGAYAHGRHTQIAAGSAPHSTDSTGGNEGNGEGNANH